MEENFVLAGESRIPEENTGLASGTGTFDWGGKGDGAIPLVWPGTPEWEFLARAYPFSPEKAYERARAFDWEVCHAQHLIGDPALLMGDWYFLPTAQIAGDVAMIGWLVNGRTGDVRVIGDVDDAWNVFPRFLLSTILPRKQADCVSEQALYGLLGLENGNQRDFSQMK